MTVSTCCFAPPSDNSLHLIETERPTLRLAIGLRRQQVRIRGQLLSTGHLSLTGARSELSAVLAADPSLWLPL